MRASEARVRDVDHRKLDAVRGLPLGNFPQALSHLAFISAAYFLVRRLDPAYRPVWQP